MENNIYDPGRLRIEYMKKDHGKARTDAIRSAIEQADLNNDIEHKVFFMVELCDESEWYGSGFDIVTVFPELLAVIDKYTYTNGSFSEKFPGIMENVLWTYEDMADICNEFYQVPFNDCVDFLNDFKERWIAYGRKPREPYRMMVEFYREAGHMEEAKKTLSMLKTTPSGGYDCAGCTANTELSYYLSANEKDKADKIAEKINDGTLSCGGWNSNTKPRMYKRYLKYYLMHGDYEKAAENAKLLENSRMDVIDYKLWASFMCAYVYNNTGRGLRIYKKHWKDIESEQRPEYMYYSFKDSACFFMGLKKVKSEEIIKLQLGNTFPLYSENNIYSIDRLAKYYYKKAEEVAKKFDKRNMTDKYTDELKMSVQNILSY